METKTKIQIKQFPKDTLIVPFTYYSDTYINHYSYNEISHTHYFHGGILLNLLYNRIVPSYAYFFSYNKNYNEEMLKDLIQTVNFKALFFFIKEPNATKG